MDYEKYKKDEMLKIIETEGILLVSTNLGNHFIIRKRDLADFIILESERTGYSADMKFFLPDFDLAIAKTFGCFFDKIHPVLRKEVIDRLTLLLTTDTEPKKVKVFDNKIFDSFSLEEKGFENGEIKNFDKFYGKYF